MAVNTANYYLEPFWQRLRSYLRARYELTPKQAWRVSGQPETALHCVKPEHGSVAPREPCHQLLQAHCMVQLCLHPSWCSALACSGPVSLSIASQRAVLSC